MAKCLWDPLGSPVGFHLPSRSSSSSSQVNGQALSKAFAPQTKPWIALAKALGSVLRAAAKQAQGSLQLCTLGEASRVRPAPRGDTPGVEKGKKVGRWLGDGVRDGIGMGTG